MGNSGESVMGFGLGPEDLKRLADLSRSRTASFREVQRARILLDVASGKSLRSIAREQGLSRNTVAKCVRKALSMGPEAGLRDTFHCPREATISPEEKAWILSLAEGPPEGGSRWTILSLTAYLRGEAVARGYSALASVGKSTVHRILQEKGVSLRPRRGEGKSPAREVAIFAREFALVAPEGGEGAADYTLHPLSEVIDSSPPLRRLGFAWVTAAVAPSSGECIVRLERRFGGGEFLALLREIDQQYPEATSLRLRFSPGEPSSSPEVLSFLAGRPGRFVYGARPLSGQDAPFLEALFFSALAFRFSSVRAGSWEVLSENIHQIGPELSRLLRSV